MSFPLNEHAAVKGVVEARSREVEEGRDARWVANGERRGKRCVVQEKGRCVRSVEQESEETRDRGRNGLFSLLNRRLLKKGEVGTEPSTFKKVGNASFDRVLGQ